MDSVKKQLADRLKSANNILVTVSRDPSIDQLAACIALTLLLNKMNKHSVAVFSGQPPSTIEFLKPDETLEKTTDSLRDFIIALDKNKADKLRYKVEDNVVRIFITPYKTSISQEDLQFSQGDFNVDVVVALGVKQQQELDEAIMAHGRILHDATVASISLSGDKSELGTISWNDPKASSLSELVTDLSTLLGDKLIDNQIATALLTGIVAETDRFSNDKTSALTMNASSALMAAGADQQLVASKLEEPEKPQPPQEDKPADDKTGADKSKADPSTLSISHDKEKKTGSEQPDKQPEAKLPTPQPPLPDPEPQPIAPPPSVPLSPGPLQQPGSHLRPGAKLLTTDSPSMGGTLNANTKPERLDPITDPMSLPQSETSKLFDDRLASLPSASTAKPEPTPPPSPAPVFTPPPSMATPATPPQSVSQSADDRQKQTLTEIEKSVHSPHLDAKSLDTARDEVDRALQDTASETPSPIQALNAQPMGGELHPGAPQAQAAIQPPSSPVLPFDNTPESSVTDPQPKPPVESLSPSPKVSSPKTAPPVPPPFAPQQVNNPFDNEPNSK